MVVGICLGLQRSKFDFDSVEASSETILISINRTEGDHSPIPAGAWTVMMVGSGGPALGMLQHLPNMSSILTRSTGPMSPLALTGL